MGTNMCEKIQTWKSVPESHLLSLDRLTLEYVL